MFISASLPKLPNKPAFTQNRQTIQNHYNDSYYKDTVHFSGNCDIADKISEDSNYSVILPREELKRLFEQSDKENRQVTETPKKFEILLETVKELRDIYNDFILDEMPEDLPKKQQQIIDNHIHDVKGGKLQIVMLSHRPDKDSYELPSDYDDNCSKAFSSILVQIDEAQSDLNLPEGI